MSGESEARFGGELAASTSNNYQLIGEVGQGGMASVHLALLSGKAGFQKLVALKQPRPSLSEDAGFMAMFLDEARLAARLNHPNVVQTYEVGRRGDQPFIAMEFIEGQPLSRMQRLPSGAMPLPLQLCIIADVLSGLHHAHELRDFCGTSLGVVHRDVSPQNVLVSYDGQAKVVDFGIAKAHTQAYETGIGLVKGKLAYMSPEQAVGDPLDRRSDLFAVGVMLWEAGAGRRLWPGMSPRERLLLLKSGAIPELAELEPHVPAALDRVCRRALEFSPALRYQSAAELETEIQGLLAEPGLRATRRDVATFMSTHFEAQRSRTRKMIEEQLGHLSVRSSPPAASGAASGTVRLSSGDLPALGSPTPASSQGAARLSDPPQAQPPDTETPSSSASTLVVNTERPAPPGSLRPWGRTDPPPPVERPRKGLTVASVGASIVLLVGVVCWLTLRGHSEQPSGAAARDTTAASPVSVALRPLALPAAAPSTSSEPQVVPVSAIPPEGAGSSNAPKPPAQVTSKAKVPVRNPVLRRAPSPPSVAVDENGVSNFGGRR